MIVKVRCVQNKMHINDWAAIQTVFDKLNKQLERTQKVGHVPCSNDLPYPAGCIDCSKPLYSSIALPAAGWLKCRNTN